MYGEESSKEMSVKRARPVTVPGSPQDIDLKLLAPEFAEIFRAKSLGSDRGFLIIQVRKSAIDRVAESALSATQKHFEVDEEAVLAQIQKKGLATEISRVTKRLNQMRLSDVRRRVLAATYVHSLQRLLTDDKADPEDTLGFTAAVLFDQEQDRLSDEGDEPEKRPAPLTKFAREIVRVVLRENRINLSPLETRLLVQDLLGADFSIKPGRVEAAVMSRLDKIVKEGPMPALVEKFVERGEIDPNKFTPAVKEAMVAYLLDRGVQVTDLQRFEQGGYDEHFVMAYERAVSSAAGKQDPIDSARQNGGRRSFSSWDFSVDTFDEIEEQGVIRENILASGAIDYIFELGERMGVFRLADALVLNWSSGAIDVAEGDAAAKLYRYWKLREERSSPEERAMLYKRVLNKGNANLLSRMVVNEHFGGLWHNLMVKVAEYIDKTEKIEEGASETSPVSKSAIYQATKELQYNLTEFCTGMAHMQARELYAQLQEAFDILRDPEIVAHFGGTRRKSLWTVIEQLSKSEFGVSPNIAAIRTLAVEGNRVYQWIADFEEATTTHEAFLTFLEAAESYILNMALVGSETELIAEDEDDFGDFDDFGDDGFEDEFDDF
jgi:hypothetical protein